MSTDLINKLSDALGGAINSNTKTVLARIVGVGSNGVVQAFSETLGTVRVLARTTDDLQQGDNIYITKTSMEKNAPYVYAGFASGAGGSRTQPGISAQVPIALPPGNDQQPGGTSGTLQYALDEIRRELRRVKGSPTWLDSVSQNLTELLHIRTPVDLVTDLPGTAALDDLRYMRATNQWYVYSLSGWIPVGGRSQAKAGSIYAKQCTGSLDIAVRYIANA